MHIPDEYKVAAAARPLEPGITNVLNGISARMKYSNKKASDVREAFSLSLSRILLTPSRVRAFLSFFFLRSASVSYFFFFFTVGSNARVKVSLRIRACMRRVVGWVIREIGDESLRACVYTWFTASDPK